MHDYDGKVSSFQLPGADGPGQLGVSISRVPSAVDEEPSELRPRASTIGHEPFAPPGVELACSSVPFGGEGALASATTPPASRVALPVLCAQPAAPVALALQPRGAIQ